LASSNSYQVFEIGIAHHVSYPHTHQQNGSAKQKHHHIVETGLALLAHAGMPLKFWYEAFLTAMYLINHLLTHFLDNLSPVERLFKSPQNYSMLKNFGCARWPHLRPYNRHKLEFHSKPCVFLGYSSLHKGYKCLEMETGRVYILCDIIFNEVVFPFSNPSSNFDEQWGDSSFNLNTNHLHILLPVNSVPAAPSNAEDLASGAATSSTECAHCAQSLVAT
jgi:hypothetical protein